MLLSFGKSGTTKSFEEPVIELLDEEDDEEEVEGEKNEINSNKNENQIS